MRMTLALQFVLVFSLSAQSSWFANVKATPSPVPESEHIASVRASATTIKGSALIDPNDSIFPQITTGGGWETRIVLVNIGPTLINFKMSFYDAGGNDLPVTFRTYPQLQITTDTAATGTLPVAASFDFTLFDTGGPNQAGWARLAYNTANARLSGYSIIRHRSPDGSVTFEATAPLSNSQDFSFYVPFDNIQGFTTLLSITNPAANLPAHVSLTFMDGTGSFLLKDSLTIPRLNQLSGSMADIYPSLANKVGVIYVYGDISLLSAVGFRYNPTTGAIASVPIANWSGMFQ